MTISIPHQLKVLFSTFPQQPGDLAAQIEAYGIALEGHDPRDIQAAVRRFIRGEVEGHNQSFPPTASKMGGVVRKCMADRLDDEHRERMSQPQLPPPEIPKSAESRQRVLRKAEETVQRLTDAMLTDDARRARGPRYSIGSPESDDAAA